MKFKKWVFAVVILAATLIASRDLLKSGYFPMHDDLQIGRMYQMDRCINDGQIPCRWVPDMGYSYGYPLFNFYPPLPYYVGEIFHLIGFSYIDSVKILFFLGFLFSAFFMFAFSRKLFGNFGGLLSAVLYLFAPYHSVDVYVRGALSEHFAMIFLPAVCWKIYDIIESSKVKKTDSVLFSLFLGLLLLSHNLMAFIFLPVFILFALVLIFLKKRNYKEKIKYLIIGGIWALGLAAFFTLPVIFEGKYTHLDTMIMGYFHYINHYVPLRKMFFSIFWGYGSSSWLQQTGMPFQIGIPLWPVALITAVFSTILFLKKQIEKDKILLLLFFFGVFLFSTFLVSGRSIFIWKLITPLKYLQFPWRFLTIVIFSASVCAGGITVLFKNNKLRIFLSLILIVFTILFNYRFFKPQWRYQTTDNERLFSEIGWRKLQTDAIFDYLPIFAKAPPGKQAPDKPQIIKGEALIDNLEKGTNWYHFTSVNEEEIRIEIPIYDFPGWKAYLNGKQTVISHDNNLGLITLSVPVGKNEIKVELTDTPVRKAGNIISVISWLLLLLVLIKLRRKS